MPPRLGIQGSLADNDKFENIFWGIPQSPADTILHRIGYSMGYSDSLKLSLWVSYYSRWEWILSPPLASRHFKSDPDISYEIKADNSDYAGSGYDRGHLAMQADMRGRSEQCEREACYLTNIAPQKPRFNRVVWNSLENKIRDYVVDNGDGWIITGPIFFDEHYETIGENKIPVPDAFYKIFVDTLDNGVFACAFIIRNQDTELPLDSFSVSIDSVEAVSNIDFFHLLPDDIEDKLEGKDFHSAYCDYLLK